jgi:hypothetical protein
MDETERDEIRRTAFENVAKRDEEAAELAARRLENLGRVDHEDERERFERRRAARPPRPEPKLDTVPMIDIDARIAAAIAAEHERMIAIVAEALDQVLNEALDHFDKKMAYVKMVSREAELKFPDFHTISERLTQLERNADVFAKLGDAVHKQTDQLASLVAKINQLCASENVVGSSPMQRYLRDLN